ncbi:MAG: hypothetical protein IPI00_09705 [Flavobacteriales bacterium]|nr:hypothetical protein [Flavobacteriales bacterium]MBK6944240.1 hypothetical protein [Flavobacteriales bacterium]MBK7240440.1 hypothetical protein [Flavobacteriales bacterium]MBK7295267.1 hypothetical protein [Flavobacteriales bacterium]MBK9533906.1 hypothetical protein [Flavobacteriales bacterium]
MKKILAVLLVPNGTELQWQVILLCSSFIVGAFTAVLLHRAVGTGIKKIGGQRLCGANKRPNR